MAYRHKLWLVRPAIFFRVSFSQQRKALGSASCRRLPNAQKSCGDSVELSIIILAPCPCLQKATEADGEDDEGEERVNVKDAAASPARSASTTIHRSHAVINLELPLPCIALPCIARETAVRLPIAASAGIAAGLTATACAVQRLESALLCFATLFSN